MKKLCLLLLSVTVAVLVVAQQRNITGIVKSEQDQPLAGVVVLNKRNNDAVITAKTGHYSIRAVQGDTLRFSSLGMITQTVVVSARTVENVTMQDDLFKVDEVVVIGYGSQKKSDMTGAVASITNKELSSINATSVDQLLQGQLAGVRVASNSGAPGGGMNIQIRGGNSMNGSNEPLYIIDGFPIEINQDEVAADASAGDAQQYTNILAGLNPNDIERIEVLKDASATAIYGSKGANGVVIITTKKGSDLQGGKDLVEVGYSFSVDEISRKLPMLEPWEWASYYNEFIRVTGSQNSLPSFNGKRDQNGIYWPTVDDIKNQTNTYYGPWGVNWQDLMFRAAKTHNVNVSVRGNRDQTNYALSANYLRNEGIIPNTDFDRIVIRGNINRRISKKFYVSGNVQFTHSEGNQKPTAGNTTDNMGVVLNSLRYNNVFPAFNPDGSYFNLKGETAEDMSINHPLLFVNEVKNVTKNNAALGSLSVEFRPISDLSIKSTLNARYSNSVRDLYYPRSTQQGTSTRGYAGNTWSEVLNYISETYVNYTKKFRQHHSLGVMAGFSYEQTDLRSLNIRVFDFFSDDLQGANLSEGTLPQIPQNDITKTKMASFYGRVNYSYKDRYLLTATFRGDGSSKFGRNNKWAYFPSFALAWRISEEPFMKKVNWITNFKLRAGYGLSGSQAISPYQSLCLLTTDGYYFGGNYVKGIGVGKYEWSASGGVYTGLGEPDLKWETTEQINVGVDLGFLKNRFNLVVDLYEKNTRDLHQMVELPLESGYSYTVRNMGKIRNRGLEVTLQANLRFGEFKWYPSVNYYMNRNKIMSLGGKYTYVDGPALISGDGGEPFRGHIAIEGHPMGMFYGYKTNGIIQNSEQASEYSSSVGKLEPGEVRYVDISGPEGRPDGKVDSYDRTIIGNPHPDFEINFSNRFSWRNLEFSFNIAGVYGNDILNVNLSQIESGTCSRVESARMRDMWTIYNPSNTQPKIGATRNRIMSDRYVEDGSFIKLRNVMIGYNFKIKKLGLTKAQIYVKGSNLLTLTRYSGYDPEVNQYQSNQKPGVDYGTYPATRTYTVGLTLGF